MKTLIIDSATPTLYICLVDNDKVLYENYHTGKNEHSIYIVSLIEEALKQNNLKVDNLDKIIVGVGPGSYTGVRMGVAVAKMFAAFKHIDLYQISTLYLMGSSKTNIASIKIDARRGNSFGMTYDFKNDNTIKAEALYKTEDLLEYEIVDETNFKVDPFKCIEKAIKVDNIDILAPNYLRDTEAERNLK